jgi:hypothetical protein
MSDVEVKATAYAIQQFMHINRVAILSMISAPPCEAGSQGGGNQGDLPIVAAFLLAFVVYLVLHFIKGEKTLKKNVITDIVASANISLSMLTESHDEPINPLHKFIDEYTQSTPAPLLPHELLKNFQGNPVYEVLSSTAANNSETFLNWIFVPVQGDGVDHSLFDTGKAQEYVIHKAGGGFSRDSTKIVNPITGRLIDAHGKTAKALLHEFKSGRVKLPRQFISTIKRSLVSRGL